MDDLRNEIRAAFEKEQTVFPPAGDLRPRLVRETSSRPLAQRPNLQWLAVAAAVMIGVLVVVGLMSSRLTNHSPVAPPKPVPTGDYGPPPAGVPLFYVGDPNHPGWYIGFDWNGTPRGTIKLQHTADPNSYLRQSADGSMFVVTPAAKGGTGQYLDRLGKPIAEASTWLPLQMWADDSKHYCTLSSVPGYPSRWNLDLWMPGSSVATVSALTLDSPNLTSGIIAIGIGACSVLHDRAVLVYNYFPRPPEVWVVRISDGKVLRHQLYDTSYSDVTASQDASLIAVNSAKSTGYLAGPTAPKTVIRRAGDGSVVASVDPSYEVLGFSADDSIALVASSPYTAGVVTHLNTIQLPTGTVEWCSCVNEELSGFFVNPSGGGFAVMLQQPSDQSVHPTVEIRLVFGAGDERTIPGSYLHP